MVEFVTAEELLAGREMTFDVEIPPDVLHPSLNGGDSDDAGPRMVRLRPLSVRDVQLIAKAAKDDEVLTSALMVQRAVVEPDLKSDQVARMHGGVVTFLVDAINRISGLTSTDDEIRALAEAPLVRAFLKLSKEFGWTPDQVKDLTIGQILLYLESMPDERQP